MHLVFDALLIDMDGTLVDSTARVETVWAHFCREHGLDFDAFIAGSHGRRTIDSVIDALGDTPSSRRIARELEAQETAATDGIVACTGAAALLAALPATSWSLVTSAGRDLARRRMQAAGFDLPAFGVYGEDVAVGKPDPACYRLGRSASAYRLPHAVCWKTPRPASSPALRPVPACSVSGRASTGNRRWWSISPGWTRCACR